MKKVFLIEVITLIICILLLIVSMFCYPFLSYVSAFISSIIALAELIKSKRTNNTVENTKKRVDGYDEAFQVGRNQQGDIEKGISLDNGTF